MEQRLHAALSIMAMRSQYTIPPRIEEREHERALHFSHERRPGGAVISGVLLDNVAALAFGARDVIAQPRV